MIRILQSSEVFHVKHDALLDLSHRESSTWSSYQFAVERI